MTKKKSARSDVQARAPSFYQLVYTIVAQIPAGKVTTYGTIATWLGSPRAARAVGYALAAQIAEDLPWQRVVNRLGGISVGGAVWRPDAQRQRLTDEGVAFDADGQVLLAEHAFVPSTQQRRRWLRLAEQHLPGFAKL